jgi:hypothetical protein
MQGQLRALWLDQPQVTAELPAPEAAEEPAQPREQVAPQGPVQGPEPAQDDEDEEQRPAIPAQRQGSDTEAVPVGAHAARDE